MAQCPLCPFTKESCTCMMMVTAQCKYKEKKVISTQEECVKGFVMRDIVGKVFKSNTPSRSAVWTRGIRQGHRLQFRYN